MTRTAPSSHPARDERTSLRQWGAVGVLTFATFLVVTSEMLPVGVLTPMADGLGISAGATGMSLTITGLVSAVAARSPLGCWATVTAERCSRRR